MNHDEPSQEQLVVLDPSIVTHLMAIQQYLLSYAAQTADAVARQHIFSDYRTGVKPNTRKRQRGDLARFRLYLNTVLDTTGVTLLDEQGRPLDLGDDTSLPLWSVMTSGLIKAFRRWMFQEGYTFETIKGSLSTI